MKKIMLDGAKALYTPPLLELLEFSLERGFSASGFEDAGGLEEDPSDGYDL
jgi:hypothetical protein